MGRIGEKKQLLRDCFTTLHIVRAPLLVTVAAAAFYSVPQQTIEVYRAIAQDTIITQAYGARYRELAVAVASVLLLASCIWYSASLLLARLRYSIVSGSPTAKAVLRAVPTVLMAAVLAGVIVGIVRAMTPTPDGAVSQAVAPSLFEMLNPAEDYGGNAEAAYLVLEKTVQRIFRFSDRLAIGAWVLLGLGLAVVAGASWVSLRRSFHVSYSPDDTRGFLGLRTRVAVYGCIALSVVAFTALPLAVPIFLGPLGVVAIFFICLTLLSAQLSFLADRHGIPYLTLLLILACIIAVIDTNDNHHVFSRAADSAEKVDRETERPPSLEDQFRLWFEARTDRDRYERTKQPYPIYLVAAEGGGIYAALHAGTVLARLQDQCPYFAHHLFGISGVSGGSVGSAIFSGLASLTADSTISAMRSGRRGACLPQTPLPYREVGALPLVNAMDKALSKDLLSPLLAGLLFTDFVQQFWPFPLEVLDRGRRLDLGFEAAMQEMMDEFAEQFGKTWAHRRNPLSDRVRDWNPKGNVPALLINTTEVETGRRRVLAPFVFAGAGLTFFPLWDEAGSGKDARAPQVSLATAASLSARFPWVSPAAWFQDYRRDAEGKPLHSAKDSRPLFADPIRLVDGGYFENSGVATAVELMRAMEQSAKKHGFWDKIQINLIVLTRGSYPEGGFRGLKDLLSPVQALLNTRSARAYITIAEADREFNAGRADARVRDVRLVDMGYPLPLGWRLSTITSLLIRAQAGDAKACGDKAENVVELDANCVLATVYRELSGEGPGALGRP
jgi:hypothetical protein